MIYIHIYIYFFLNNQGIRSLKHATRFNLCIQIVTLQRVWDPNREQALLQVNNTRRVAEPYY